MLTVNDLNKMTARQDYYGFGYLGHEQRSESSDKRLIRQANSLGLLSQDLFSWVNSKPARHFMDNYTSKVPFPLTKENPFHGKSIRIQISNCSFDKDES